MHHVNHCCGARCVPPVSTKPKFEELVRRMEFRGKDTNQDGALSLSEYAGGKPTLQDAIKFRQMDRNRDGKLTLDEYKTSEATVRPRPIPMPRPVLM